MYVLDASVVLKWFVVEDDSSYLALALDLGWPLVTADRRFAQAVAPQGDVRLLDTF